MVKQPATKTLKVVTKRTHLYLRRSLENQTSFHHYKLKENRNRIQRPLLHQVRDLRIPLRHHLLLNKPRLLKRIPLLCLNPIATNYLLSSKISHRTLQVPWKSEMRLFLYPKKIQTRRIKKQVEK